MVTKGSYSFRSYSPIPGWDCNETRFYLKTPKETDLLVLYRECHGSSYKAKMEGWSYWDNQLLLEKGDKVKVTGNLKENMSTNFFSRVNLPAALLGDPTKAPKFRNNYLDARDRNYSRIEILNKSEDGKVLRYTEQ